MLFLVDPFLVSALPELLSDPHKVRDLLAFLQARPLVEWKEPYKADTFFADLAVLPDKLTAFDLACNRPGSMNARGMRYLAVGADPNGMASCGNLSFMREDGLDFYIYPTRTSWRRVPYQRMPEVHDVFNLTLFTSQIILFYAIRFTSSKISKSIEWNPSYSCRCSPTQDCPSIPPF